MPRILHVLSQRPGKTGSGVTLEALVRNAQTRGWEQAVVMGTPAEDATPAVADLAQDRLHSLPFGTPCLDFAIPGMSDVMPYPSTVFSQMTVDQLTRYEQAWAQHLRRVLAEFQPDIIHAHHIWLLSSWLKGLAPNTPVVTHCHATGLRQMQLCPHLADAVKSGCRQHDAFVVLHTQHRQALAEALDIPEDRITVVGAGYRQSVFHDQGRQPATPERLVYAGKYSNAKGLPQLLDAFDRVRHTRPSVTLHIAGSGSGTQADRLRERIKGMGTAVVEHGMLSQEALGDLLRTSKLFVLPSFYEGLPLVLVEALACGNRVVATGLEGIREHLAPQLGDALDLIPPPRRTIDVPLQEDLPTFVHALENAIIHGLESAPIQDSAARTAPFTWQRVFDKVEEVWRAL